MISIVTPTYNSEQYLEECIFSIINQTYQDFEHIIVDGGSKDRTLDIIKEYEGKYNMRWVSEKDNGMYDAISKGFNMAKGDIFCWLNSDDMYLPWTLSVVAKVLKQGRVEWCIGIPTYYTENGMNYLVSNNFILFPQKYIGKGWMDGKRMGCIQQESCFWTRGLYEKAGGLDTRFKLAGDYDLWQKFAKYSKLYTVNSVLSGFRIHRGQKSEDKEAYYKETGSINLIQRIFCELGIYRVRNYFAKKINQKLLINLRNI